MKIGADDAGVFVGSFVFAACATTTGVICVMICFIWSTVTLKPRIVTSAFSPGPSGSVALLMFGLSICGSVNDPGCNTTGLFTLVSTTLFDCWNNLQFSDSGFPYGLLTMSCNGVPPGAFPTSFTV